MSKEKEILEKAVEKAEANGLKINKMSKAILFSSKLDRNNISALVFSHQFARAFFGERKTTGFYITCHREDMDYEIEDIKKLKEHVDEKRLSLKEIEKDLLEGRCHWTDECCNTFYPYSNEKNKGWRHHLSIMVNEENPLKYLEKFL